MTKEIMDKAAERMAGAEQQLLSNFASVRTGRASAMILDRVKADYYGVPTPINQMAAIKTPDAHTLVIEPWDKSALGGIDHAIQEANLGVMPNNDGSVIRLSFPPLTEERRKEFVKECRAYAEESRVAVRNARRDANTAVEKAVKNDGLPEDEQLSPLSSVFAALMILNFCPSVHLTGVFCICGVCKEERNETAT